MSNLGEFADNKEQRLFRCKGLAQKNFLIEIDGAKKDVTIDMASQLVRYKQTNH